MKKLILPLILFSLGGATLSYAAEKPQAPATVVETATAIKQNIAPSMWVPGTVISRYDSKIASETSGVLNFVVEVGDSVDQGGLLAKVNDQQINLQLRLNKAELKRLQTQLLHAQKQLERTETLSQTNSAAQSQLDEWIMQRDVLQQELELAQIQLEQTQYLSQRTEILAPFKGIVVERFLQTGEHIGIGEELLRLVSTDQLEVSVRAPVGLSQYVRAQQQVPVRNKQQEIYTSIRSVVPVGDIRSRMMEVRVQLDASNWIIGEAVDVAISKGPQQVSTVVPRDALVLRNNEVYLFKVENHIAKKVVIEVGEGDASNISVTGKIQAGDIVVTRGAERLDDGKTVEILKEVASH